MDGRTQATPTGRESDVERRLHALGLTLQAVPAPIAAYQPAVTSGHLVWTSGQIPLVDGRLVAEGQVGADVDLETAQRCARQAALNAIAVVKSVVGDLDLVDRVVKVVVFVSSAPHFTDQALAANGASEVLEATFGSRGVHARSAVGVAALPFGAPVEVELVVAVAQEHRSA